MKKNFLNNFDKEKIIKALSSHLIPQHPDITVTYLFGSFITSDSFADIDVGVITAEELAKPLEFEIALEKELEGICKYSIDVRVLNGAPLSFCQSVIREGRVIVDREPNVRSDFEGRILKLYFDFARFRRRYLAEVMNAPI